MGLPGSRQHSTAGGRWADTEKRALKLAGGHEQLAAQVAPLRASTRRRPRSETPAQQLRTVRPAPACTSKGAANQVRSDQKQPTWMARSAPGSRAVFTSNGMTALAKPVSESRQFLQDR